MHLSIYYKVAQKQWTILHVDKLNFQITEGRGMRFEEKRSVHGTTCFNGYRRQNRNRSSSGL